MYKKICTIILTLSLVLSTALPVLAADNTESESGTEYVCQHEWSDWSVVTWASIFHTGSMDSHCVLCGETKTMQTERLTPYVAFAKKTYNVKKGKSLKIYPAYANGDTIKSWKSNKKKVATVNKYGKVVGKKTGKAKITVTMKSGKKATCIVKVTKAKKKAKTKKAKSTGTVYWTPSGSVYHTSRGCPTLSRSRTIKSGSVSASHKSRVCKVCGS